MGFRKTRLVILSQHLCGVGRGQQAISAARPHEIYDNVGGTTREPEVVLERVMRSFYAGTTADHSMRDEALPHGIGCCYPQRKEPNERVSGRKAAKSVYLLDPLEDIW